MEQIGVDEVGRGPALGPFTFAVVRIDPIIAKEIGVKDSKKLSEKKREQISPLIKEAASFYKIIDYSVQEINEKGVGELTKIALREIREIIGKQFPNEKINTDGAPIKGFEDFIFTIKGDDKIPAIGAASIIAKVHRDHLIKTISLSNDYDISNNKGYLTKKHIEALKKYGPSEQHRLKFIRNHIA